MVHDITVYASSDIARDFCRYIRQKFGKEELPEIGRRTGREVFVFVPTDPTVPPQFGGYMPDVGRNLPLEQLQREAFPDPAFDGNPTVLHILGIQYDGYCCDLSEEEQARVIVALLDYGITATPIFYGNDWP